MGFTDDEKLTADPEYEKRKEMEMENAQNPQSGREDNGSVDKGSS